MNRAVSSAFPYLLLCMLAALMPVITQAAGEIAAWVQPNSRDGKVPVTVFKVERAGKAIAYPAEGLMACDTLRLTDARASVQVILSNNQRLLLDAESPGKAVQVPCGQPGFFGNMLALAKSIVAQTSAATTPTKGTFSRGGLLVVPALGAYAPHLTAGTRSLYIAWAGGEAPYKVQLLGDSGSIVAQVSDINALSVRLPETALMPGRYTLRITGQDGKGVEDNELTVVTPNQLPAAPAELAAAKLAPMDYALLYAYYLEGFEDGRWTLEAVQTVAALAKRSPNTDAWLRRFGGDPRE